jgi:signal peptidase I
MKPIGSLVAVLVVLLLAGCGTGGTEVFEYPSESMEPTIAAGDRVTIDLDAYEEAAPALGDIIAFHPPAGADKSGFSCGVAQYQRPKPCPKPTSGFSSEIFIKRVVASPGDEISIRDGQPVVNGKAVLTDAIQKCSGEACNLPTPITIPPGQYFVMGDNSGASFDSRYWGPLPRAGIIGRLEE